MSLLADQKAYKPQRRMHCPHCGKVKLIINSTWGVPVYNCSMCSLMIFSPISDLIYSGSKGPQNSLEKRAHHALIIRKATPVYRKVGDKYELCTDNGT